MPMQATDIIIYVCPRQTGKTYKLMENAAKSEDHLIICQNRTMSDIIRNSMMSMYDINANVYSASSRSYCIESGSDVFVDEYDLFRNADKRDIFDKINKRCPKKVEIYTSVGSPKVDDLELYPTYSNESWDLLYDGRSMIYSVSSWGSPGNMVFEVNKIKNGIDYKPITWKKVK